MHDYGLVVVGAHTGIYLKELIDKYNNNKILLVEPVPYNYEILKKNYEHHKNIQICKYGILDKKKIDNFFYVKKDSVAELGKHWATGIGSFDKNHVLNHKTKRFKIEEKHIERIEIEFITFADLIRKFSIRSIEMLQLDVEGAEYKIMKSIDYEKIEINQILFEAKHLDGTFKEGDKLEEIKNILLSNNYKIKQIDKENILAFK